MRVEKIYNYVVKVCEGSQGSPDLANTSQVAPLRLLKRTIQKETFIVVIFWGYDSGHDSGYDPRNSNILPVLKSGHVEKKTQPYM